MAKLNGINVKNTIEAKLDRLMELYHQQWESGYSEPFREFDSRAVPDQSESELEVSREMLALSKEVATYYEPLVDKLAMAGVLTVNVLQPTEGCAVFEITTVMDGRKSYFNEGKIMLLAEEEQINGEGGKLIPEFWKRLGKFVKPVIPSCLGSTQQDVVGSLRQS